MNDWMCNNQEESKLKVARRVAPPYSKEGSLFEAIKREESEFKMSELLTVSEVADILRVDNTTVRRWVKQGTFEAVVLPHVNARQAYRIKRETVDKLLGQTSTVS